MLSFSHRINNVTKVTTTNSIKSIYKYDKRKITCTSFLSSQNIINNNNNNSFNNNNNYKQKIHKFHTHVLEVTKKHKKRDNDNNELSKSKVAIINADGTSMTYDEIHKRAYALSQIILEEHPSSSSDTNTNSSSSLTSSKSKKPKKTYDLKQERVAFICEPSSAYLISLFSIWGAGGIAVPIHYKFPSAEIEYILEEANITLLLCDKMNQYKLDFLSSDCDHIPIVCVDRYTKGKRFLVDADRLMKKRMKLNVTSWNAKNYSKDRGAYILFTSGTTGNPKGVIMNHGNVMSQIDNINKAWEITSNDRLLHFLPLHHVHGLVNNLLSPLTAGATIEFTGTHKSIKLWEKLKEGKTTIFMAVPTIYHNLIQLMNDADKKCNDDITKKLLPDKEMILQGSKSLRLTISGSMSCPLNILNHWKKLTGHIMLERYGMTEIGMALTQPLHGQRVPGCVGQPFPNVLTKIFDTDTGEESKTNEGELYIKGPSVFKEYYERPDVTNDAFDNDGWFKTGDIVRYHSDSNNYQILGRSSVDIIKCGGYKLSALEIESTLSLHPDVIECIVVGIDDEKYGQIVAAIIKFPTDNANEGQLLLDKVETYAKIKLAHEKVPTAWFLINDFDRNPMGKIDKKFMMKACSDEYHGREDFVEFERRDPNIPIPGEPKNAPWLRGDYPI